MLDDDDADYEDGDPNYEDDDEEELQERRVPLRFGANSKLTSSQGDESGRREPMERASSLNSQRGREDTQNTLLVC